MSKITNDGLTRSRCTHGNSGRQKVNWLFDWPTYLLTYLLTYQYATLYI